MTLEALNAMRARNGKAPLSSWKNGNAKLAEAIAKEEALLTDQSSIDETDPSMPMGENGNELVDELPVQSTDETAPSDLTDETTAEVVKIPRGALNTMCVELLQTDMPYEDIVAAIKERFPTAKTTARSLASVAMDLRADGLTVPTRRKPAAAKPAKSGE